MGCSFIAPIQSALGSVAKAAGPILPVVASAALGPAAGALLGTSAAVGGAAVGALTGGLTSAATGGNVLTGALMGGAGGYLGAGGNLTGTGAGNVSASTIQGIQQAVPGLSAADAGALANVGYTGANLAGTALADAQAAAATLGTTGLSGLASNVGSVLGGNTSNLLGSLGSAAASIYGGQQAANGANQAAQTYANAGNLALAEQARQFGISQANQAPWLTAGQQGLNAQLNLMGLGPQGAAGMNQALLNTPDYQWTLQQGQKALNASNAARGGMGSGKAMTAAQDWGQGLASQQYGNVLQRLANLSTTGQNTATQMGTQGMNYAGNVGNIGMGVAGNTANAQLAAGAAQQQGTLGAANALANLLVGNKTQSTLV